MAGKKSEHEPGVQAVFPWIDSGLEIHFLVFCVNRSLFESERAKRAILAFKRVNRSCCSFGKEQQERFALLQRA